MYPVYSRPSMTVKVHVFSSCLGGSSVHYSSFSLNVTKEILERDHEVPILGGSKNANVT